MGLLYFFGNLHKTQVLQAGNLQPIPGKLVVLSFDDRCKSDDHPWAHTNPVVFKTYMDYLRDNGHIVIAMRDHFKYVDPSPKLQEDRFTPIQQQLKDQQIKLTELCCEYTQNPLGIDTPSPRFSWILKSEKRGQMQSAYRILVASNQEKLDANIGDKWDSGKVASDNSINIVYQGKPLSSGEKCHWKARVWDKDGLDSNWSETASFEMGLLNESDWQGQWISMNPGGGLEYVPGKFAQAVAFNGKGPTIQIPHYATLKPDKQITISAWIKPHQDSNEQWQEIYRKEDGEARCLLAFGKTGDQTGLWFGLGINGTYTEECGPIPPDRIKDGKWHLVAATFDGQAKRTYLDGKEIETIKHTGRIDTTGDSPGYIGSYGGQKEFFHGFIDDVRIYNIALYEQQIQELAKGIEISTGVVGRWKLDGDLTNSISSGSDGIFVRAVANNTAQLLRKEFVADKIIHRARVYFAGLGWSELYINGKKISDDVLSPALTDYYKQIQYVTYDVTDFLKPGENALGVILGNGWFSAPINDWQRPWSDRPQLILHLNIEYADGTQSSIGSDRSWKGAPAPIGSNNVDFGEVYDAREEQPGWCTTVFDDTKWRSAEEGKGPGGKLTSQMMPAMQVMETIKPIKLTNPEADVYVYEFDRLFGGWTRLHVNGPQGAKVRIEYSSRILENGLIDKEPWPGDQETDFYVLKGDPAGETYEPRFTFHPVQYVQISGYPGKPALENLEGRIVHTNEDLSGYFECSNPLFNRIHDNVQRTLRNALKGFLLDCLHREPIGYNEPASVSSSLFTRKHLPRFWDKYAEDIRLTARDDGSISDVSPVFPGMVRSPDVSQNANYPMLIWYLYQIYDDRRLLENHYPVIKGCTDYITDNMCDGSLVVKGWLGDHMLPGHAPGYEKWLSDETPPSLIWTALYYRNLRIVSEIANVLGQSQDTQQYAELAEHIKKAFNDKWLDRKTSHYGSESQTSEILPLALDLVPEEHRPQLIKNIARTITQTDKEHLRVGHAGVIGLIESLTVNGLGETMYDIVNQTTYPGWGYMVTQGATTVWESWGRDWAKPGGRRREDSMTMLAGVNGFFYRHLAGIEGPDFYGPGFMEPGYRKIHVTPYVLGDLKYARASIKTVRGMVSSCWEKSGNSLTLEVTIPVNSVAKVSVPKLGLQDVAVTESGKTVWKNGKFIKGVSGIIAGSETDDYVTFDIGSGSYTFRLWGQR
jgi:alpha-L-rhamnosidase